MIENSFIKRLRDSRLVKDSFWAVFGNGIGSGLLLLSGIIIARLLGKEVYGEYGFVKTTMFLMASFASLGLNYTSTKYIAEACTKSRAYIKSYAQDALLITFISSCFVAFLLFVFSNDLASYLEEPKLKIAFRVLGGLIILRSYSYTLAAILAGFGAFRSLAINNVLSGIVMLFLCYPLTYLYGLTGAFCALVAYQIYNVISNMVSYREQCRKYSTQIRCHKIKEMILFSLPVSFQEISYAICNWGGVLLITKLSTLGELGIYSATTQWNAIIIFIPSILSNVILSHLSGTEGETQHSHVVKKMLKINLICAIIPFSVVYLLSNIIVSFYGPTFEGMKVVLRTMILSTIFSCCSKVLYSEFIAIGKTWSAFLARCAQDIILLSFGYILIRHSDFSAALAYAIATVVASLFYLLVLIALYKTNMQTKNAAIHHR